MVSGWNENIDCPDDVKACGRMILNNDYWDDNDNCGYGGVGDPKKYLQDDCRITVGVG